MVDGFLSLLPAAANADQNYPLDAVDQLHGSEEGSFWFRARNRLIADLALRFAPGAENVLEIGCSAGYVLASLHRALPHAHFVATDVHVRGLRHARERLGGAGQFYRMDARWIPFDTEFDLIGAFDVLEHIAGDVDVLHELRRAVRPGGHILLTVPQHPFMWSAADAYACHKRRYRLHELQAKARAVGFDVVLDSSFVTLPFPAMAVKRLAWDRWSSYAATAEMNLPRWMDELFEGLLDRERQLILAGVTLPFGGTRVLVARRPATSAALAAT